MLDIRKYESVAMFDLPGEERDLIARRAGALLEGFGRLEAVVTDGTEPLVAVLDIHTVLREDLSVKFSTRDDIMANAPEQCDGFFQVPGTLD